MFLTQSKLLIDQGLWDLAEQSAVRAFQGESFRAEALCTLGIISRLRGNLSQATELLFKGLDLAPDSEDILLNLAEVLVRLGDVSRAEQVLSPRISTVSDETSPLVQKMREIRARAAAGGAETASWPFMLEYEVNAIRCALEICQGPVSALEWGSGHSTVFFSSLLPGGSTWDSVEHTPEWAKKVQVMIDRAGTGTATLHLVPNDMPFNDGVDDGNRQSFGTYVDFPLSLKKRFQIILVDGRARADCLEVGWNLLSEAGIMILHNAERTEYFRGHPKDGYRVSVTNVHVQQIRAVDFFAKDKRLFDALLESLRSVLPSFLTLSLTHATDAGEQQTARSTESVKAALTTPAVEPSAANSKPELSCVFVNTYYAGFLNSFYARNSHLLRADYAVQRESLAGECFGDSDFYSRSLKSAGWTAQDLIVNAGPLQSAWAREYGCDKQGVAVAIEQIRRAKPSVVYLQDLNLATAEFVSAIRPYTELIVGQIASPIPSGAVLSEIDILVSSFPHFVQLFREHGLTSYYQPLAFEEQVIDRLGNRERDLPLTFVGGISPSHENALALLDALACATPIQFWGYGADLLAPQSPVRARHNGEAWGLEMFRLLRRSMITVNRHIDVAENHANNMRLFEATGCGALLITDYKDNLHELFEIGTEIVAYRSPEECISLVNYYLAHPEKAAKIARAGQMRTLREHTYSLRMRQTARILSRHLKYRRERGSLPPVDMGSISEGYEQIDCSDVTEKLTAGWKSKEIPIRQRALVQQELEGMYRGRPVRVFEVLADSLRPYVPNGSSILELGCASGYYGEILEYLLNREIRYCGLDYSSALISMARSYYPDFGFINADGAALPLADNSFDVVVTSAVLLHVPDFAQHVRETCRVARNIVVAHRTPVYRNGPLTYLKKKAYEVETVELVFNERELIDLFESCDVELIDACEFDGSPTGDSLGITYVFRKKGQVIHRFGESDNLQRVQRSIRPILQPSDPTAQPITWERVNGLLPCKLYAGDVPGDARYSDLVGLSISHADNRHILHDITKPFPIPDSSVDSFQVEDVFEHIPHERLGPVVNEIYRVLKPGARFRLSVPDYRCDVILQRCVRGANGRIVFDPGGGGTLENPGHVWHPTIESVRAIVENSAFSRNGSIDYLHYYETDGSAVLKAIDYREGFVYRTPDHDERVQNPRRPFSIVVDLIKAPVDPSSSNTAPTGVPASRRRRDYQVAFPRGPVVLVSRDIAFTFPLSYAYLAGYLREQGEEVVVLFKDTDAATLVNRIMSLNPVLVGFGNLYPELKQTAGLIEMLNRAGRKFPVVVGGQMVTPTPEFAVTITHADFGVIGEGEITLHKLVRALREGTDISSVRGLAVREGNRAVLTGPGEYIEDLDTLPPVPYDLFPTERWLPIGEWYAKNCPQPHWRLEDRVINVHGGRGCPFRCNFCYHHSKPRYRSLDVMFDEAAAALDRFDANMLYFSDDLVLASPARAAKLVDKIARLSRKVDFSVSTRFDLLARMSDDLLGQMKAAGCRIMGLGIESGSDRMLELIGKNCTAATIEAQLERLKNVGILPTVSIMVGQHTETVEDVEMSIGLMKRTVQTNPQLQYAFSIMTPFPGSPVYEMIFEKGLLSSDREFYERYFAGVGEWNQVVNLSAMTQRQVIEMHQRIEREYRETKEQAMKRT